MGGAVVGYGMYSQYLLGFGLFIEGEYLVVRCWSWLDGELAMKGPFLVMSMCQKEHFGIEKDPPDALKQLLASGTDFCRVEMLIILGRCSTEDIEIWVRSSAKTIPLFVCTSPVIGRRMTHACVSAASGALLMMSLFTIQ